MKIGRSFFTLAFVSLIFLGLLVLGIPVAGFAGTPHTCPNNIHQAGSLGGVPELDFVFVKNCASETSLAITWKAFIYDDTPAKSGTLLCSMPQVNLPPYMQTKHCGPTLPTLVKVTIHYKTSALGAWMTHTEYYTNP